MAKEIKIIIRNTNSSTAVKHKDSIYKLRLEQEDILLTPKQYEEVWKKLKEIEEIINP